MIKLLVNGYWLLVVGEGMRIPTSDLRRPFSASIAPLRFHPRRNRRDAIDAENLPAKKRMSETLESDTPTVQELAAEVRRLRERVEDLEDLRDLNEAIERNAGKPGTSMEDLCREFGWEFVGKSCP